MRQIVAGISLLLFASFVANPAFAQDSFADSAREMLKTNSEFGRGLLLERLGDPELIAALAQATRRFHQELVAAGFSEAEALEIVKATDLARGLSR